MLHTVTDEYQPFDVVIIFAGPGGAAFGVTAINNLKTVLEAHDKTVFLIGNGERDLQEQDIVDANKILITQQNSKKNVFL